MRLDIEFWIIMKYSIFLMTIFIIAITNISVIAIIISPSLREWITQIMQINLLSRERIYDRYTSAQEKALHNILPPSQAIKKSKYSLSLRFISLFFSNKDKLIK